MQKYRTKGQDFQSGDQAHVRGGRFSLRRLWRDDSGTTAIEFAFIALGLVYLMVGIIEFSMAMTVGNSLEAATNMSSRLGKTGYVDEEAQLDQEETIMDEVERRVGPMIDMEKLEITHEVYNDFEFALQSGHSAGQLLWRPCQRSTGRRHRRSGRMDGCRRRWLQGWRRQPRRRRRSRRLQDHVSLAGLYAVDRAIHRR